MIVLDTAPALAAHREILQRHRIPEDASSSLAAILRPAQSS